MTRIVRFLIVGILIASLASWPLAAAATKTVKIPAKAFDPVSITVTIGDTVRWIHQDPGTVHTVTATTASKQKGESFSSSRNCPNFLVNDCMRNGDVFTHTFDTKGTFVYYCKVHGRDTTYPDCGMCGVVKVNAKKSTPASPTGSGASPTGTGSGSASPSPTNTTTATGTSSSTLAGGPGSDEGNGVPTVGIAAIAVVLLGGSGFVVYRTMIRGQR